MNIAIHPICPAHHHVCDHPQLCDGFCDLTGHPVNTTSAEPEENHPWDWIDDLRFLFACALAGFAAATVWAFGSFISNL